MLKRESIIKQELERYINLTDEQKEAIFKKALEEAQEQEKQGYEVYIEGLVYQLVNELHEWYQ